MTRVLAVASEVFPLVKTGGLADVVGALPAALAPHGVEMKVLVPGYPAVMRALAGASDMHVYASLFGGPATLRAGTAGGLDLIVLDAPHLFDRQGNPYLGPGGADWLDNWKRFAALSLAAADLGRGAVPGFVPALVHAHDWQAALVAAYLHFSGGAVARSILTIHNLAFQGAFPAAIFPELQLPAEAFALDGVEYYGGVGYLKAGIRFADAVTTVSPTYAEEICTPAGGMGLDGLLRGRRDKLHGIVNGIDVDVWNPETDTQIARNYTAGRLQAREANKRALEERFALDSDDSLIFCVISRLTLQKGMDILAASLDGLVATGARLVVLGSGDAALEGLFRAGGERHQGRIGVATGYDEALAHLIQAGADAILIPSRFEPCGLTQFYGLRYGCVPVVARVGGLADTIIDANDAALSAKVATGIQFLPVEAGALAGAMRRALALFADRPAWRSLQKRGMRSDVSWSKSAARYASLYRGLTSEPAGLA
ncbi:MAG TPA: glycogen synthase GlgA [Bauldia sp.]|nr:glycogen synthase GlgA [Bauldia sp.]